MKILSTAYFPPIEYFAVLAKYSFDNVRIEAWENYQKQSYRNRCYFYGANGKEMLQVPVVHENGSYQLPIKTIRIDYSTPWVARTKKAIASAYSSAAYYEYYCDDIFAILDSKPEYLWELNLNILKFFLRSFGLDSKVQFTDDFTREGRVEIHPKKPYVFSQDQDYFQVFAHKQGFIQDLSAMDLLFNCGPESKDYLLAMQELHI